MRWWWSTPKPTWRNETNEETEARLSRTPSAQLVREEAERLATPDSFDDPMIDFHQLRRDQEDQDR